jgi:hypothetical protein
MDIRQLEYSKESTRMLSYSLMFCLVNQQQGWLGSALQSANHVITVESKINK